MNSHSWRTIAYWSLLFLAGGISALKGSGLGDFTTIVSFIGIIEHFLAGNITNNIVE